LHTTKFIQDFKQIVEMQLTTWRTIAYVII